MTTHVRSLIPDGLGSPLWQLPNAVSDGRSIDRRREMEHVTGWTERANLMGSHIGPITRNSDAYRSTQASIAIPVRAYARPRERVAKDRLCDVMLEPRSGLVRRERRTWPSRSERGHLLELGRLASRPAGQTNSRGRPEETGGSEQHTSAARTIAARRGPAFAATTLREWAVSSPS